MIVNDAYWIIIDNVRVMLQIVVTVKNNFRGMIYDCNMFIVQVTGKVDCSIITWLPIDLQIIGLYAAVI